MNCFLIGLQFMNIIIIVDDIHIINPNKNAHLVDQFNNLTPPKAQVIREGIETQICASKLVPGDLIKIWSKDIVPADARLIECFRMKVNMASFIGEWYGLNRKAEKTSDNPLETENLTFFKSVWTQGYGFGVVIYTGDKTLFSKIFNRV